MTPKWWHRERSEWIWESISGKWNEMSSCAKSGTVSSCMSLNLLWIVPDLNGAGIVRGTAVPLYLLCRVATVRPCHHNIKKSKRYYWHGLVATAVITNIKGNSHRKCHRLISHTFVTSQSKPNNKEQKNRGLDWSHSCVWDESHFLCPHTVCLTQQDPDKDKCRKELQGLMLGESHIVCGCCSSYLLWAYKPVVAQITKIQRL